tara:strand:+ start:1071 stop:1229 length:159 start_codon:yes stop_codon:yes gene_type:complete
MTDFLHHTWHQHPSDLLWIIGSLVLGVFVFTMAKEVALVVVDRIFYKGKKDE